MDLCVVSVNLSEQPSGEELRAQIGRMVDWAKGAKKDAKVVVGTAEYSISSYLTRAGVPVTYLPYELSFDLDVKLQREAMEFANELITKAAGQRELLFNGVNLFDVLLYDLTIDFRTILRIKGAVQSRTLENDAVVLVTAKEFFPRVAHNSEVPVSRIVHVGGRGRLSRVQAAVKSGRILQLPFWKVILSRYGILREAPRTTKRLQGDGNGRKRVLFVVTDTGTRYTAEPIVFVLKEMRKHKDLAPFVVVDNAVTESYFEESGIYSTRYDYYQSPEALAHWARSESVIRRNLEQLTQAQGSGTVRELMLLFFLRQYMSWTRLAGICAHISWLTNVFHETRPDGAVILPVHAYFGKSASLIAGVEHVPTLSWIGNWPYGMRPEPELALYDATDYLACYSDQFKQILAGSGITPEKIIPTGNPKFDSIYGRNATEDRERVSSEFRVRPGARIFVVTTYLIAPGTSDWVRALVRQLARLSQDSFKLIIRPHPDEKPDEYLRILHEEGLSSASICDKKFPLYTLLSASDIVFTSISVTGSEAVLFGKPLICINLSGTDYSVRYDKEGVAVLVKKEKDILPAIETVLKDRNFKRGFEVAAKAFQRNYTLAVDGRCSERFIDAIRMMLRPSSS